MNLVPGRTHIRSRSPRLTASSRCNNVGKGSRQIGSVTSGQGLALRAGPVGLEHEAGLGRARAGRGPSLAQVDCVPLRARRRWAPRSGSGCGSACSRAPAFCLGSRVVGGGGKLRGRFFFLSRRRAGAVTSRGRPSVLLPASVCRRRCVGVARPFGCGASGSSSDRRFNLPVDCLSYAASPPRGRPCRLAFNSQLRTGTDQGNPTV